MKPPSAAFCSFFEYNTGAEGNDGRCKNIVRSCESMTRLMQPGESLDFNAQAGPYKKNNGYFPAPVLIDGGTQIGYGGGTCQSSSTLYNAIRQVPGITVLMRRRMDRAVRGICPCIRMRRWEMTR